MWSWTGRLQSPKCFGLKLLTRHKEHTWKNTLNILKWIFNVCVFFQLPPILVSKAALISLQLLLVTCHVFFPCFRPFCVWTHQRRGACSSEPTHPFICFSSRFYKRVLLRSFSLFCLFYLFTRSCSRSRARHRCCCCCTHTQRPQCFHISIFSQQKIFRDFFCIIFIFKEGIIIIIIIIVIILQSLCSPGFKARHKFNIGTIKRFWLAEQNKRFKLCVNIRTWTINCLNYHPWTGAGALTHCWSSHFISTRQTSLNISMVNVIRTRVTCTCVCGILSFHDFNRHRNKIPRDQLNWFFFLLVNNKYTCFKTQFNECTRSDRCFIFHLQNKPS